MNQLSPIQDLVQSLSARESKFSEYNENATNVLDFEQECLFARQALMANDFLSKQAMANKQSLFDAIYNVATTGISLNPAHSHGYLVPRKVGGQYKVCLDISYRGFLKIATDTGLTKYMKAELVYSNDDYQYNGFDQRPTFRTNPFKDRGELIGVYAMAVLHDDSILVENMDIDQVYSIRDSSEAYKSAVKFSDPNNNQHYKFQNCVWVKFETEMVKKTVLKRAFKTLPQSKGKEALENAAHIVNEHEGIDFKEEQKESTIDFTSEQSDAYKLALQNADYTGLLCIIESLSNEGQTQLWDIHEKPLIPEKGKGRYTEQMQAHLKAARELREDNLSLVVQMANNGDQPGLIELFDECNQFERDYYTRKLNTEQQSMLNEAA